MTAAVPSRRRNAAETPLARRMADETGLTAGPKTLHLNVKVQPALFEAAARRAGSRSPTAVVEAGLALLATQEEIGPWLASQWGVLADIDPKIIDEALFL